MMISEIVRTFYTLIPASDKPVFDKLLSHNYAFEKHCEDADFDYTNYQFPSEILKIILGEN